MQNGTVKNNLAHHLSLRHTIVLRPLSTDEGLARFKKAAARLKAAPPANPNIILGPLTHDEWIAMNLNHAALHLGYMHER